MPLCRPKTTYKLEGKPIVTSVVLEICSTHLQMFLLMTGRSQTGLHPLAAPGKTRSLLLRRTVLGQEEGHGVV